MLQIQIRHNMPVIAATLRQVLPGALRRGIRRGMQRLGEHTEAAVKIRVEEIDAAPIPTSGTGRPLWEHTGNLQKGVGKATVLWSNGTGVGVKVGIGGPAAIYARSREGLGGMQSDYAWMPKNPAGGIVRRNEFLHDARADVLGEASAIVEAEIEAELQNT